MRRERQHQMNTIDVGHIVTDPDVLGGEPIIAGHRIAVSHIAIWVRYHHMTPETIASKFHLSLAEIHSALAYYYDHKDEIDSDIEEDRLAEEMARKYPHGWNPSMNPL